MKTPSRGWSRGRARWETSENIYPLLFYNGDGRKARANMDSWTLFFVIVGVTYCVSKFMDFIEWLDTPRKKP